MASLNSGSVADTAISGQITTDECGFTLVEFLVSTTILLIISTITFKTLVEIQRMFSYQTEVQDVLNNVQIAMESVVRRIRQAGNDPLHACLSGVTIVSPTEIRIKSDLTGSTGLVNPDKGDPDGDTDDSGEDVTIRYNATSRSLELVPNGGSAQPVANYISAFSMQYYDSSGNATSVGSDVCKVALSISAASALNNPQTRRAFGFHLSSAVQLANR